MREIKLLRDKSENELKNLREKSDTVSKDRASNMLERSIGSTALRVAIAQDAEVLRQRQLEEVQLHVVSSLTLHQDVPIERFCSHHWMRASADHVGRPPWN